jgi:hypothetical protein
MTEDYVPVMYDMQNWQRQSWQRLSDRRHYHAELRQTLFGDWVLTCKWGHAYSRRGRSMETLCQSYEEGLQQMKRMAKRRSQRGYVEM